MLKGSGFSGELREPIQLAISVTDGDDDRDDSGGDESRMLKMSYELMLSTGPAKHVREGTRILKGWQYG